MEVSSISNAEKSAAVCKLESNEELEGFPVKLPPDSRSTVNRWRSAYSKLNQTKYLHLCNDQRSSDVRNFKM